MLRKFLVCASVLGVLVSVAAAQEDRQEPYVLVTGQGSVAAAPDQASLSFGLETASKEIKQAQHEGARRTQALLAALKQQGIGEKNVKTTVVQISPRYDYVEGKQRFAEYVAHKTFIVHLKDIERYGAVLEAVLAAGVTQVSGVEFGHSRKEGLEAQALQKAVQDARHRADILAAAAGKKVGEAITIESTYVSGPPVPFYGKMAMRESVPNDQVSPGEIDVRAAVTVKFQLR